ncbi:carbohydrate kinase [bacterium 1XD21-13]|nr:carbohydrate kinase [bacterium 1XD21-13]
MALGGIDIGTTGCKMTVYEEDGTYLSTFSSAYPFSRSAGIHFFDAGIIIEAVVDVLQKAILEIPTLHAIGISSFGEAFVLLDQEDQILYPTLLNTDPRGIGEVEDFVRSCKKERICAITGASPHSMFSVAKILWVKKHEPQIWARVRKLLLIEDFVVYKLTGVRQVDYALASRTQLFDINQLDWSSELLEILGIPKEIFSKPVAPGTCAGILYPKIAKRIGCEGTIKVVTCCHDQIAAAIGAGVLHPGCAVDGAGTHECITPVFTQLKCKEIMYQCNLAFVPFVGRQYVTYGFLFTGCALTKWFIDTLGGHAAKRALEQGKSVFQVLEEEAGEEPSGLLVLPHFDGAATPYMDENSRGAFVGMSVGTREADLYQAVMEGIVYEMRLNMEKMREAGIEIQELHATGGGANSKKWLQMKADILNVPVKTFENHEAGAIGCIILIGKALGVYDTLEQGIERLVIPKQTFVPNKEKHEAYQTYYERYKRLYKAVRPLSSK